MKRPPKQVWCLVNERGVAVGVFATKREAVAKEALAFGPCRVAGPFILAERVRQR